MVLDLLSLGAEARVIFRLGFRPQGAAPVFRLVFETLAAQAIEFATWRQGENRRPDTSDRETRRATLQCREHGR